MTKIRFADKGADLERRGRYYEASRMTFKSSTSKTARVTLRPQIWGYIKAMASETSGAAAEGDEPITPKIFLTELLEVALSEAIRDRLGARSHSSGPESDHHRMRPAKQKVTTGE